MYDEEDLTVEIFFLLFLMAYCAKAVLCYTLQLIGQLKKLRVRKNNMCILNLHLHRWMRNQKSNYVYVDNKYLRVGCHDVVIDY